MKKGIDFIGVCVVYFCHDGAGKFVMAKRSQNARDEHGRWDIGGGGIEHGESVTETLKKEIMEEYCADILNQEFLGYRDVHRIHNGEITHWIALDFKILVDPNKVKIGEPHKFDDIGWFSLEDYPENCHSQFGEFVRRHGEKLG
ncbi:MAG: RNA pyrophosphohydrolase [Candidatus Harrisonbacteria bacterium CG10_big_fil_rev_8_21_14_0_10_45_28]|uniref:RNA pyrophosphohydrolase n=1 Tax=Candidatus Harrisonbacteria bacterium CG10_big_fil_rev_8_21_14_0_10_45_28 TaxID=1974586 RepID=A0A2H0UN30_9BACT|nr:MAG: RNA pyrophosphohydrolase [Candidatus Harrisonbacteria bacterium CG10_big_fil_rev_8_21_14_0_10_45_28]